MISLGHNRYYFLLASCGHSYLLLCNHRFFTRRNRLSGHSAQVHLRALRLFIPHVVVKHWLAVFALNNYTFLGLSYWSSQEARLKLEHRNLSIGWTSQKYVPVESPTEIGDTGFKKVHDDDQGLLKLRFPDRQCWLSTCQSNHTERLEFLTWNLEQGWVDAWDSDRLLMSGKGSH